MLDFSFFWAIVVASDGDNITYFVSSIGCCRGDASHRLPHPKK